MCKANVVWLFMIGGKILILNMQFPDFARLIR